ncbi:MAG: alkaline phosphatase family protein [Gemmatimonadota bacterium]|nr:alkaline phosphatase family protein [Gemmatimonadota bacterium]
MRSTPILRILSVPTRVVALAVCVGCAGPDAAPVPKLLIIGIDGVRPDVLAAVPTPHLDSLIAAGTYSDRAQTGLPTISGPGWSSMLIGVWPAKHGVLNNDFTTNHYDRYPDLFTRIESVRPELHTFVVADWLPLVTTDAGGPLIARADSVVVLDGYDLGWAAADSQSTAIAAAYLRQAEVDAAFVYLGNPDETSHEAGSIGAEYRAAIALADRHVGELLAALRSRPGYARENWLILVSTDHGRTEAGGHGGESAEERTIFYLASGPAAVVGTPAETPAIVDVAVTALTHLGIPIDPAWGLDGKRVVIAR